MYCILLLNYIYYLKSSLEVCVEVISLDIMVYHLIYPQYWFDFACIQLTMG